VAERARVGLVDNLHSFERRAHDPAGQGSTGRVRRLEAPEHTAAKLFGERLFEAVFQGDLRDCLSSS
jgi:hypothetical protein